MLNMFEGILQEMRLKNSHFDNDSTFLINLSNSLSNYKNKAL